MAQNPSKFGNIRALHIDYESGMHDAIVAIPQDLMEHVTDLALVESELTAGNDPTMFNVAASALI